VRKWKTHKLLYENSVASSWINAMNLRTPWKGWVGSGPAKRLMDYSVLFSYGSFEKNTASERHRRMVTVPTRPPMPNYTRRYTRTPTENSSSMPSILLSANWHTNFSRWEGVAHSVDDARLCSRQRRLHFSSRHPDRLRRPQASYRMGTENFVPRDKTTEAWSWQVIYISYRVQ
jgi:hypothetical protein